VRDLSLQLSAVGMPQENFGERDLYQDLFSKQAVLMESLIQNHPFVDGNKCTGIVATALFLQRNSFQLMASSHELANITQELVESVRGFDEMDAWLRKNTQPISYKAVLRGV
jgi:death on curing protein